MQSLNANRVYAPLLLGITILIGIFIAKPMYESYMSKQIQYASLQNQKIDKQKILTDLERMQRSFTANNTWSTEFVQKVNKLWKKWDTTDVLSAVMLNEFTTATTLAPSRITIGDIVVNKWSRLPSWLSLWNVNFTVSAWSLDDMIAYITHLTQTSSYAFTIDSIVLPIDTGEVQWVTQSEVSLSLVLGIYYYE